MRKSKLVIILSLVFTLCLCLASFTAYAEETEDEIDCSQVISVGDLPYFTGYSEFDFYDTIYTEFKLMTGMFDKEAEGYGLIDFDTWNGANALTLSTQNTLCIENWQWKFETGYHGILQLKSNITGTIVFDFSNVNFVGWMESAKGIMRVNRLRDGAVTNLRDISNDSSADFLTAQTYNITLEAEEGDVFFYEIGATSNGRNVQNLHLAKIIVTPTELNDAVVERYFNDMTEYVDSLESDNYTEEDWSSIVAKKDRFLTGEYDTIEELVEEYQKTLNKINEIEPDPLKALASRLAKLLDDKFDALNEEYYSESDWEDILAAYESFADSVETIETEQELQALYDDIVETIDSKVAIKQEMYYFYIAGQVNSSPDKWIHGDVCDLTLKTGTVEGGLLDFDSYQTTSDNAGLTVESVGTGALLAGTWQWKVTKDYGIILIYKANVNCEIDIVCTRVASGDVIGWVDNCELNTYIVRNENIKRIRQIEGPGSDEEFSGTYYLKANDMLYIELKANIGAGQSRNIQTPFKTTAYMDSTAFDEEAYAEQNNDLSQDTLDKIEELTEALTEYYQGLDESDYSATNWLELEDCIREFEERCESEVRTVEDVQNLYDTIYARMQAVETLAQAAERLASAKQALVAELQEYYDNLIKTYKYSKENKDLLDSALAAGISAINAANSEVVANTEKNSAIANLDEIERSNKASCKTSIEYGSIFALMMVVLCGSMIIKKRIGGKA